MKILFIDSNFTHNGNFCVRRNNINVCGRYENNTKYYYKTTFHRNFTCDVVAKKYIEKHIFIVRQKSSWRTFKILCHELMHWLSDILLPHKLRNKFDNWLDRN